MKKESNLLFEINDIRRHLKLSILTEEDLLIKELDSLNINQLNEGWWENTKYALSKLGRYKANGKVFGKSKVSKEYNQQIADLLEKESNYLLKHLDGEIKKYAPEFPNNKSEDDFLLAALEIAWYYDSIINATKINPNEPGFLPIDAAEVMIDDLIDYVRKILDVDLKAVYTVFTEGYSNPSNAELLKRKIDTAEPKKQTHDSERMKTLNSNLLPLLLSTGGINLKSISHFFNTNWFKNLIDPTKLKVLTTPKSIEHLIDGGQPDEKGLIHWMSKIWGKPINNGGDIKHFIDSNGGIKSLSGMFIGNNAMDAQGNPISPEAQSQMLYNLAEQNPNSSLSDLFNQIKGTYGSMESGLHLFGISKQASFLAKTIYTTYKTTKTAVKTGTYAKWGLAAKILGPIGIAAVAGSLVVKLARWKGKKSSRAQILNDVLQYLQFITPLEGTPENPRVIPDEDLPKYKNPTDPDPGRIDPEPDFNPIKDPEPDNDEPNFTQTPETNPSTDSEPETNGEPEPEAITPIEQEPNSEPTAVTQTPAKKKKKKGSLAQPEDIDSIIKLMEFINLNRLLEGHAKVSNKDIITIINEATGSYKKLNESLNGDEHVEFFKNLADTSSEYAKKIKRIYLTKYQEDINLVKLDEFLKTIFTALSKTPSSNIVALLKSSQVDPTSFKSMMKTLSVAKIEKNVSSGEDDYDESNLPDTIGDYDLTKVKRAARIAINEKSREILLRNKLPITPENMNKVMIQIIEAINNTGVKSIPKKGSEKNITGDIKYSEPLDTDQALGGNSKYYKEPIEKEKKKKNNVINRPYY